MKIEKWEKRIPETIEELKEWYTDNHLPKESTTRFYIGRNYKYPKAFGIYKDSETGRFIVYKNKRNGTRVIRYKGLDEDVAVRELYLRLVAEIKNQRKPKKKMNFFEELKEADFDYSIKLKEEWDKSKKDFLLHRLALILYLGPLILVALICIINVVIYSLVGHINGYYDINDGHYYYQYGSWYLFNDKEGWLKQEREVIPNELLGNKEEYKVEEPYSPFEISKYYSKYLISSLGPDGDVHEYDNSYDYDYDYDYDSSWNSDYTDWDSDW